MLGGFMNDGNFNVFNEPVNSRNKDLENALIFNFTTCGYVRVL